MIIVLTVMILGIICGYLIRERKKIVSIFDKLGSWLIFILLFVLGISVGTNDTIISNLKSIGAISLIVSIASLLGSVIVCSIIYTVFFKQQKS